MVSRPGFDLRPLARCAFCVDAGGPGRQEGREEEHSDRSLGFVVGAEL